MMELLSNILLYVLAARGIIAVLGFRPFWWPKEKALEETFKLSSLQIGAHCGLCGRWMADVIAPKDWAWDLCNAH